MSSSKDDKSLGPTLANIGTETENFENAAKVVSKTKPVVEPYIKRIGDVKLVSRGGNPGPIAEKPKAAQIDRPNTTPKISDLNGALFQKTAKDQFATGRATEPASIPPKKDDNNSSGPGMAG